MFVCSVGDAVSDLICDWPTTEKHAPPSRHPDHMLNWSLVLACSIMHFIRLQAPDTSCLAPC